MSWSELWRLKHLSNFNIHAVVAWSVLTLISLRKKLKFLHNNPRETIKERRKREKKKQEKIPKTLALFCCFPCPSVSIYHINHPAISREKDWLATGVYESLENQSRFNRPLAKREETTAQPRRNGARLLFSQKCQHFSVIHTQAFICQRLQDWLQKNPIFQELLWFFRCVIAQQVKCWASNKSEETAGQEGEKKEIRRKKEKKWKKLPPQTN